MPFSPHLIGKSLVERIGDMGPLVAVGLIGERTMPAFCNDAPADDGQRNSPINVTYVHTQVYDWADTKFL